jgi:hypothetical protein
MANYITLSPETTMQTGFTHKCIITPSDLVACATGATSATATVPVFPGATGTLPVGSVITRVGFRTPVAWTSTHLNALAVEIGYTGSDHCLLASTSCLAAGAAGISNTGLAHTAAVAINAFFTQGVSSGNNYIVEFGTDASVTGVIEVYLGVLNLSDMLVPTK